MLDTATESRSIIPGLNTVFAKLSPYSYAFMRFCTGMALAPHGIVKLFFGGLAGQTLVMTRMGMHPPGAWALLVAFTECFCALAVAFGLFTRLAALFIIGEMFVIAFFVQIHFGYFWTAKGNEYPLLLLLLMIGIFFRGGGRFSLDHLIGKEL